MDKIVHTSKNPWLPVFHRNINFSNFSEILTKFISKSSFLAYFYFLQGLLFAFFNLGLCLSHQFSSNVDQIGFTFIYKSLIQQHRYLAWFLSVIRQVHLHQRPFSPHTGGQMENSVQMRSFLMNSRLVFIVHKDWLCSNFYSSYNERVHCSTFIFSPSLGRSIFPPFLRSRWKYEFTSLNSLCLPLPPPRITGPPQASLDCLRMFIPQPSLLSPNLLNQVIPGHTLQSSVWVLD